MVALSASRLIWSAIDPAYGRLVITDAELATAVAGRPHWAPAGAGRAVYTVPGTLINVSVQRVRYPVRHDRYMATVVRNGVVDRAVPYPTAALAVSYAERVR